VACFSQGGTCKQCLKKIEEEWILNFNKLDVFSIYIDKIKSFINFKLFYVLEMEDSPERAISKMSKDSGAILGCSDCKCDNDNYCNDKDYDAFEPKTLQEAKQFYMLGKLDFETTKNKKFIKDLETNEGKFIIFFILIKLKIIINLKGTVS
jgi:hypothetical protein